MRGAGVFSFVLLLLLPLSLPLPLKLEQTVLCTAVERKVE